MSNQTLDLDTLLQNDLGRKIFALFLKDFNNSSDNLLTLYLICCCFQNQRIDDRHRIKQILEKTYNACFVKNQLPHLNIDLKQKLCDSLKKSTYNESIFNAVKKELKLILENEYFPLFLASKLYKENLNSSSNSSQWDSKVQFDDILDKNQQFSKPQKQLKASKTSSSSSSITAQIPQTTTSSHNLKQSNKLNKTSTNISISSKSINTLNESTLSLNINKSSRSNQIHPPNPYHVITKPIPTSCQDSEIQSIVSFDENLVKRSHAHSKLDKHIKQNLIANKNACLNMPEFQPMQNSEEPTVPLKTHNSKKAQIPLSESDPKKFFELLSSKLEQYLYDSQPRSVSNSNLNSFHIETNFNKQQLDLNDQIDSQLDEHLDRVYNTNKNNSLNMINLSKIQASPKMCVKNSDYSFNGSTRVSNNLSTKLNNLSINQVPKKTHQHHFYQLTSTSKEVDIDSQNNVNNKSNYADSGVASSTRSVTSIERVNDWLTSSANQNKPDENSKHKNKLNSINKEEANDNALKTTVAYYLPGEDLAYISQFNGKCLTLAQFKHLITKKGNFRYFFKTKSDLLDEECVVYQEATDDNSFVPMFNNKVIAKIEKY